MREQSAQRESNPHVRHGKAAGSRYIMGAFRSQSTRQESNPHGRHTKTAGYRYITGASYFASRGGRTRTLTHRFGDGDAAVTSHPFFKVIKSSSRQVIKPYRPDDFPH